MKVRLKLFGNSTVYGVLLLHLKGKTSWVLPEKQADGEVAGKLLCLEAVSLQEDGTAPNIASPGWDLGAAGCSTVSPQPPSFIASLTVHVQCSQLIDWPQNTDEDQGDGKRAR